MVAGRLDASERIGKEFFEESVDDYLNLESFQSSLKKIHSKA